MTGESAPRPATSRRRPVIALDGPGSSGKSSVGAAVAAALGLRFFDSGLLYRALAWAAILRGVDPEDGPTLAALAPSVTVVAGVGGRLERVVIGGHDVSTAIRTPEVDRGIVVAGRDIGTVVLPDADVKIWLDASTEVRAARRARERGIDPGSAAGRTILGELLRRDGADGGRAIAPARPSDDAVHVRTDGSTLEQTVTAVLAVVTPRLAAAGDRPG